MNDVKCVMIVYVNRYVKLTCISRYPVPILARTHRQKHNEAGLLVFQWVNELQSCDIRLLWVVSEPHGGSCLLLGCAILPGTFLRDMCFKAWGLPCRETNSEFTPAKWMLGRQVVSFPFGGLTCLRGEFAVSFRVKLVLSSRKKTVLITRVSSRMLVFPRQPLWILDETSLQGGVPKAWNIGSRRYRSCFQRLNTQVEDEQF